MEKKHILLIENDETEVEFFKDALEESQLDFCCSTARNAEQASKILKNLVPDIIFLDVNLPKRSGTIFLKKIKTTTLLQNIPVILYSTMIGNQNAKAVKSGISRYILLPGNVHAMASVLQKFISDLSVN